MNSHKVNYCELPCYADLTETHNKYEVKKKNTWEKNTRHLVIPSYLNDTSYNLISLVMPTSMILFKLPCWQY